MPDKPWKVEERKKCRALGGERSGPTGRDTPDCVGVHVALEVKHYKKFVFLTADWNQAVENAAKVGLPPVLNVRERGRGGRDCVQLRRHDLVALHGRTPGLALPDDLVRIPWDQFVCIYHTHFNEGDTVG